MKGNTILETSIQGNISTNSNREKASLWKDNVARSLGSLDISLFDRQKISVDVKFWISSKRLKSRHNDLLLIPWTWKKHNPCQKKQVHKGRIDQHLIEID